MDTYVHTFKGKKFLPNFSDIVTNCVLFTYLYRRDICTYIRLDILEQLTYFWEINANVLSIKLYLMFSEICVCLYIYEPNFRNLFTFATATENPSERMLNYGINCKSINLIYYLSQQLKIVKQITSSLKYEGDRSVWPSFEKKRHSSHKSSIRASRHYAVFCGPLNSKSSDSCTHICRRHESSPCSRGVPRPRGGSNDSTSETFCHKVCNKYSSSFHDLRGCGFGSQN